MCKVWECWNKKIGHEKTYIERVPKKNMSNRVLGKMANWEQDREPGKKLNIAKYYKT